MPRGLRMAAAAAAPAMAPTGSVAAVVPFKSLLRLVTKPELAVKVIAAWVVWFILRQLQSILGPMRRRSRHCVVQYGAMAAYYLPTVIAFYTANAVQSSPSSGIKLALSFGCSFLLFACARGAVTMTAFTLDGGPLILQSWRLLPYLLYFTWQQWRSIWLDHKLTLSEIYDILVFAAPAIYVLLAKPRSRSAILDQETKEFADYMTRESTSRSSSSSSPSPLFHGDGEANSSALYDRCRYPFMQLGDGGWITFSDVLHLQQRGRFPRDCAVDLDVCLSYSFCRLLARRYFGFPCPEDGDEQVRDFALTELLEDWNRAFTIVEVQLALLHDYFFTNYHSKIASGLVSVRQGMGVALKVSLLFLGGYALGYLIRDRGNYKGSGILFIAAFAVPVLLMYIVIAQPEYPFLPRRWHPIRNVFLYYSAATGTAPSPSAIDHSSAAPRSKSSRLPYWRNKIGQYSVMEDYDRRSYKKTFLAWWKVHVLSEVSYSFVTHHPAEEEDVNVPDSVKRFLARTIKEMNCPPTIGTRSLDAHRYNGNMLGDLSWTLRQGTLTHIILIWHIATCYCDMMSQQTLEEEDVPHRNLQQEGSICMSQSLEEPSTGYREVAMTLSKYCAYLVAFLPELLPENSLTVKVAFQRALQQQRDLLGGTRMSMLEKRRKIQELELPQDVSSLTTFERGVRLGRQLEQQPDALLRWKVMADFWAEMILHAASSDNAASHIEQLAQGGEFVTHLWALLCNAGIMKPAPPSNRGIDTTQHPEGIVSVREEKSSIIFPRSRMTKSATV